MAAGLGILIAKNVKAESSVPIAGNLPSETRNEPVVIEQSDFSDDPSSSSRDKPSHKSNGSFEKKHISLKDTNKKSKEARKEELNKSKRDSNEPKVPNFMGLNKKIAIIVGIIAGFILLVLAYIFLPTAKVILNTKAQKTPINVQFTLDAGTKNQTTKQLE